MLRRPSFDALSQDLIGTVSASSVAEDEPYPYDRRWEQEAKRFGILHYSGSFEWHIEDRYLLEILKLYPEEDPTHLPLYNKSGLERLISTNEFANETGIIKKLQPLLMPSVFELAAWGSPVLKNLSEDLNQTWTHAKPIYGPAPRADMTVGFDAESFSDLELLKMANLSTPVRSTKVTESTFYPFAICNYSFNIEAAGRRNHHSAAVVMRSLIELYRLAEIDISKLDRRILAFSLSHNRVMAQIYAHCPLIQGDKISYHRKLILHSSLELVDDDRERWRCYHFISSVYLDFAHSALQRIKAALKCVDVPELDGPTFMLVSSEAVREPDAEAAAEVEETLVDGSMYPPSNPSVLLEEDQRWQKRLDDVMSRLRSYE